MYKNLLPSRRARMTGWFDPGVLSQTAWLMTVGEHLRPSLGYAADRGAGKPAAEGIRVSRGRRTGEFWLDYVATSPMAGTPPMRSPTR